jgi:tetratricopeptide (TPR) repeat protein
LALCYLKLGQAEEALAVTLEANHMDPDNSFSLSVLTSAQVAVGQHDAAIRTRQKLEQLSLTRYVAPTHLALASLALGEKDKAFHWLNRGLEARDVMLLYLKTLPACDNIRDDPRYAQLLRHLGLTEAS